MDVISIILDLLESEKFNEWIFEKIRDRLYYTGKDVDGNELQTDISRLEGFDPHYARFTVLVKQGLKERIDGRRKGDERTENVTLYDTGDFYQSFAIEVRDTFAEITADFIKNDGHLQENFEFTYASREEFEDKILNLSDTEINQLMDIMSDDIESILYVHIEKTILQNY